MTAKEFYNSIRENKTLEEIMKEYARIKCLEAIKNTRYRAADIVIEQLSNRNLTLELNACTRDIQNIPNQDVMPEL